MEQQWTETELKNEEAAEKARNFTKG